MNILKKIANLVTKRNERLGLIFFIGKGRSTHFNLPLGHVSLFFLSLFIVLSFASFSVVRHHYDLQRNSALVEELRKTRELLFEYEARVDQIFDLTYLKTTQTKSPLLEESSFLKPNDVFATTESPFQEKSDASSVENAFVVERFTMSKNNSANKLRLHLVNQQKNKIVSGFLFAQLTFENDEIITVPTSLEFEPNAPCPQNFKRGIPFRFSRIVEKTLEWQTSTNDASLKSIRLCATDSSGQQLFVQNLSADELQMESRLSH